MNSLPFKSRWIAGLVLWLIVVGPTVAHEVRPALLQITERGPTDYEILWKQPVVGDMAVRLRPQMSSGVLDAEPNRITSTNAFLIKTWSVTKGAPLDGQKVVVEGLDQTVTDVLLRVATRDGREINAVIRPGEPPLSLSLSPPKGVSVPAYVRLGIEHILTGIDHLMFVLGLMLLIGPNRSLLKAITAFTVAHSVTLALAALGIVHFPSAVIEALVALSILFVACELFPVAGREDTLTRRRPWLIAFIFGLLHGLAFAGALAQIGLPPQATPQALFLFNVGVEIGQLVFIAAAFGVILILRQVRKRLTFDTTTLARLAPAYVIGGFSAYWLIERIVVAYGA